MSWSQKPCPSIALQYSGRSLSLSLLLYKSLTSQLTSLPEPPSGWLRLAVESAEHKLASSMFNSSLPPSSGGAGWLMQVRFSKSPSGSEKPVASHASYPANRELYRILSFVQSSEIRGNEALDQRSKALASSTN